MLHSVSSPQYSQGSFMDRYSQLLETLVAEHGGVVDPLEHRLVVVADHLAGHPDGPPTRRLSGVHIDLTFAGATLSIAMSGNFHDSSQSLSAISSSCSSLTKPQTGRMF